MARKKPKGPRGGAKHTPGRDHDRKSAVERKKRFARKARMKKEQAEEDLKKQWENWDKLNDDQKQLLPHLKPTKGRPEDGGQSHS